MEPRKKELASPENITSARFAAFLGRTKNMRADEIAAVDRVIVAYNTDVADPKKREKVGIVLAIINRIKNM